MAIRKFLDLSTAHLSQAGREILQANGDVNGIPTLCVRDMEFGWWLWTGTEESELKDVPTELLAVMQYANAQGCEYILFDCDAEELDDLPTFEWSEP